MNERDEVRDREEAARKATKKVATTDSNPDPITGEPGAHPFGVAGGGTGGALAGAAIGGAVGGPVGAAVGGAIGAVAGGYAGKGAAEMVNPTEEEGYWRTEYKNRPYADKSKDFDYYSPGYRYGWENASNPTYQNRPFDDVQSDLERDWSSYPNRAGREWREVKGATRDAYERIRSRGNIKTTQTGKE